MQKCSICAPPRGDGTPEREAEVNSLLGAGESHKEAAKISGCSQSSITRHAKHSQAAISAYAQGGTQAEIESRAAWTQILELARQRNDVSEMRVAQKQLDALNAQAEAAKPKPRKGPSNVAEYKADWNLCRQCLWSEMLGYNKLPSCSSAAYAIELTAKIMAFVASESEQKEPRWDLVSALAYSAVGLRAETAWPPEYEEAVSDFKAALVEFQAARKFAVAVRKIEDALQEMHDA